MMPVRSVPVIRRRPKFADLVLLDSVRYRVCAAVVAPTRTYWLRPEGAEDASRDRLLTAAEWSALAWDARAERWEAR